MTLLRSLLPGARSRMNVAWLRFIIARATALQKSGQATAIALSISTRELRIVRAEIGADVKIFSGRIHKIDGTPVQLATGLADNLTNALSAYRNVGGTVFIKGYPDRDWGLSLAPQDQEQRPSLIRVEASIFGTRPSNRKTEAFAYVRDARGLYFDGRIPSDFEILLDTIESGFWKQDSALEPLISGFATRSVQKYPEFTATWNETPPDNAVLIVGQVAGDAATLQTDTIVRSNVELAQFARDRFPDRPLYYKAHPFETAPADIAKISGELGCRVIPADVAFAPLCQIFKSMMVMTSGAGLEAALAGVDVHTTGVAFYSHRGFTTDHCPVKKGRRINQLTPQDVYAAFLGRYARYAEGADAKTCEQIPLAQFLDRLERTIA